MSEVFVAIKERFVLHPLGCYPFDSKTFEDLNRMCTDTETEVEDR